jgi:hypothetical protein
MDLALDDQDRHVTQRLTSTPQRIERGQVWGHPGRMGCRLATALLALGAIFTAAAPADEGVKDVVDSVSVRYAVANEEAPDFQKHVVPLLGKLGCNGRACHGSFQGRGGFRLSLFGYDFQMDHDELYGRVNPEVPDESLILMKPLMQIPHEGGQRMKPGSWEHRLLLQWVKSGSPPRQEHPAKLERLEVTPAEILFTAEGQQQPLRAIAVWSDGTREDVTTLCRFQTNDDQIADITAEGVVHSGARGDTHVVASYDKAVVPVPVIRPVSDQFGDHFPVVDTPTRVDELVAQKLRKVGIVPSATCTDAEFLRRASLDVTGTLPTPAEVRAFLADSRPDKRRAKIDELLERPGYVAWWTTKLCDFTGNNYDTLNNVTPVQNAASQHWYQWIFKRVEQNVGYDDLVEGIVLAVSREPGESYQQYCENVSRLYHKDGPGPAGYANRTYLPHFWARQNFQTSEDRVIGFAYTFLGTRIQCAQCHKHPFDRWTQEDFKSFEGFFRGTIARQGVSPQSKDDYEAMVAAIEGTDGLKGNDLRRVLSEQVTKGGTIPLAEVFAQQVRGRPNNRNPKQNGKPDRNQPTPATATLLGGAEVDLSQYDDVRQPLMDWLRSPDNPLFARAFVNRVWANYFHAGLVQPSDDMNLANPPVNAPLLDYLATSFIEHDFDMKWLHREILNSRTYQLSWVPNDTNRLDERNFSRNVPRRIPAEIVFDMMVQATRNDDRNAALVTALEKRAINIPGSGSRRQDNNPANYALTVFGRSTRISNCDCDRTEEPSLLQTIFVRNDAQLLSMIDDEDGWLQQTAREHALTFSAKSQPVNGGGGENRRAQLKQRLQGQVKTIREQLARAEQAGREEQVKNLRKRLKQLKQQAESQGVVTASEADAMMAVGGAMKDGMMDDAGSPAVDPDTTVVIPQALTSSASTSQQSSDSAALDTAAIVTAAYLRTLSRYPSSDELEISQTFIAEAADPVSGIRDVFWALINTREFLVNH